MLRRLLPMAAQPADSPVLDTYIPESLGPRWRLRASILPMRSRSATPAIPAMPHMNQSFLLDTLQLQPQTCHGAEHPRLAPPHIRCSIGPRAMALEVVCAVVRCHIPLRPLEHIH